jgi:type IV pilus assembly protein PilA
MRKQTGFTLIELMIVVAIVAILAAIALPAYQTYTKKAKFSEVVTSTGAYKTAIEVCYQTTDSMANCITPSSNGIPANAGGSGYVKSVEVGGTSAAVTITATGAVPFDGTTYILEGTPSGGQVLWEGPASGSSCTTDGIC